MNIKTKKYIGVVILILVLVIAIGFFTKGNKSSTNPSSVQAQNVAGAKKSMIIDREFSFPIRDDKGDEVSQLKYTIENAELRDEIIVKGQKATTVAGRTFLILTVTLTNSLDKTIKINTRDYVRLLRNGNQEEQLAPEIHNDPVEVQPISIKNTRIGFPINDSDIDLQLSVGEIKGQKEIVPIAF